MSQFSDPPCHAATVSLHILSVIYAESSNESTLRLTGPCRVGLLDWVPSCPTHRSPAALATRGAPQSTSRNGLAAAMRSLRVRLRTVLMLVIIVVMLLLVRIANAYAPATWQLLSFFLYNWRGHYIRCVISVSPSAAISFLHERREVQPRSSWISLEIIILCSSCNVGLAVFK